MRRRDFIRGIAGSATSWPLAARAQQPAMPMIGVLRVNPRDVNETFAEPMRRYMKALGWEDGRNIKFLFVWADGHNERMPELAKELVAKNVDLIVTFGNPAVKAVEGATTTIPVVALADDMIASGLANDLRRMRAPNMTGVSILATELDVKRLELLHEAVPRMHQIGALVDPSVSPRLSELDSAARTLGLELVNLQVHNPDEINLALNKLVAAKVEAVNVLASPLLNASRNIILPRMRTERLPAIFQWPEVAAEGGFLAYGPRFLLAYRHVISLVDKILRGARPTDLPIEEPNKFDLVINLKVAEQLGLTIPVSLLLRADEVIE
jgi:putative tryptophan/tyrosine transport system substrate-binding protein